MLSHTLSGGKKRFWGIGCGRREQFGLQNDPRGKTMAGSKYLDFFLLTGGLKGRVLVTFRVLGYII